MPTERTPDPVSEASRLLTERDTEAIREAIGPPSEHHRLCASLGEPGPESACDCYMQRYTPGLAALDRLVAALVARDAALAALNAERELRAEAFQRKDAQACTFECERDDARAEVAALKAEVTQLRAALEATRTANESLAALNLDYLARESALERLAHDRGEALERIAANAAAWHGPEPDMGHVRALAVIASWAREALAGVVPPE